MQLNVVREVPQLKRMTVDQLRTRYGELFGEATLARHKGWLVKRIAWRMQSLAEGGLTVRARQRAVELAREVDLRLSPPKSKSEPGAVQLHHIAVLNRAKAGRLPAPGTVITRPYKGGLVQLKVLADGFEYEGEHYKSLSAVAKRITGSHCNGYLFFRLGQHGGDR